MLEFSEIFIDCTKFVRKIKKSNYLDNGIYPIIDQGQDFVIGYTNDEKGLYKDVPAIIFGDHTRIIKYIDRPFFIGADGVKVLKTKIDDVDLKYLYYALRNIDIINTGYNRHFKWLKESKIKLPDLKKQQRIVTIFDSIENIVNMKNVQLTAYDHLIRSRFVEMFGTPLTNERKWEILDANDVCIRITDGSHYSPKDTGKGYPMLSVKDMTNGGFVYDECKHCEAADYEKLRKNDCIPLKNDVLIAKDGSYFYYGFVIKEQKEQAVLSSIAILRPNIMVISPEYLKTYMMSEEIVRLVGEQYVSGAALKRVILKGIRKIPVMIPPISSQNQFSDFVEQIEKMKLTAQQSLDETQILFDSLMQEYFG